MLTANVEPVNIKLLTKLGKSATETYNLLTEVYGDQCLSRTQVFVGYGKGARLGEFSRALGTISGPKGDR